MGPSGARDRAAYDPDIGTYRPRSRSYGDNVSIAGTGAMFNLALGGAISRNLILYGDLYASSAVDPTVESDGAEATLGGTMTLSGVGIGLAWYSESNFYLGGSLGFMSLTVEDDLGFETETESGGAVNLNVGKEWWVSDNWGLGIALNVLLGQIPEEDLDGVEINWGAAAFNLALLATYY